jgi:hypothetical protein
MADQETEHKRAVATDVDVLRREWFNAGYKAGTDDECARIQAVEEQGSNLPGHEDLVAKLKYDGKTTGPEAAVQILAAEKKRLSGIAADLHSDAPPAAPNSPTEDTGLTTRKIDSLMSPEQAVAAAKTNWQNDPKLHHEFTGEDAYVAFCKAVAAGRVRVIDKPRKRVN